MKKNLLKYGFTTVIGLAIVLLLFGIKNGFKGGDAQQIMGGLSDGFFVAGVVIAGLSALVWASGEGGFDGIRFASKFVVQSLFYFAMKDKEFETYGEYKERRSERSKPKVWPYLVIGVAFILIATIFLIVYYKI